MNKQEIFRDILRETGSYKEALSLMKEVHEYIAEKAPEVVSVTVPEAAPTKIVAEAKPEPPKEPGPNKAKLVRRITAARSGNRYIEGEFEAIGAELDKNIPLSVVAHTFGRSSGAIEQLLAQEKTRSKYYPKENGYGYCPLPVEPRPLPVDQSRPPPLARMVNGELHV